jgi:hypothetical protein
MKFPTFSLACALCVLAGPLASAALIWDFEGASGSGPYLVNTPVDAPFQASSRLSTALRPGVTASIASGATAPASGDYLFLQASSQAINDTALVFTLDASGPVAINSLSYDAIVYKPNKGNK